MSKIRTIKGVDKETWMEFKNMAERNNLKLGTFFKMLVKEHNTNSKNFWENLLEGEKIFSDKEAKEMKEVIKKVRNEYGFRK